VKAEYVGRGERLKIAFKFLAQPGKWYRYVVMGRMCWRSMTFMHVHKNVEKFIPSHKWELSL
jgi:hypothetical protein